MAGSASTPRIALIGASGLIGSLLLERLRDRHVLALSRRAALPPHVHWREKIGTMDRWPALLGGERIDVAIATIGSTWAKVGNWEDYEAIDRHALVDFARAAQQAGARQMIVVSSSMADAQSRNRYLAMKGRMEADLVALGFERLDILRPGLLRGTRGAERRVKERIGILLSPLFNRFVPDHVRAIDADRVADAIAALAGRPGEGAHVHHNRAIRRLGKAATR